MTMHEWDKLKINGTTIDVGKSISVPYDCPYCQMMGRPEPVEYGFFSFDECTSFFVLMLECQECGKRYAALYEKPVNIQKPFKFLRVIPIPKTEKLHPGLVEISGNFEKFHMQAAIAEREGAFDVAAIGYRTALEYLVKDYAIKVEKEEKKIVQKHTLSKAIMDYVPDYAKKSADATRILGNDFTHFLQKYPEMTFEDFKKAYNNYIRLMEFAYEAKNPPVEEDGRF